MLTDHDVITSAKTRLFSCIFMAYVTASIPDFYITFTFHGIITSVFHCILLFLPPFIPVLEQSLSCLSQESRQKWRWRGGWFKALLSYNNPCIVISTMKCCLNFIFHQSATSFQKRGVLINLKQPFSVNHLSQHWNNCFFFKEAFD